MKRISLLLVLALLVFGAIDASASCKVCRLHMGTFVCATVIEGAVSCQFDFDNCTEVGVCPSARLAQASSLSQWTVASVERLDEQRSITVTRTAQLAPKPAVRNH